MDMHIVPFAVLAAAALLVLLSRPGLDAAVPVALIPWTALTPDVGAQMPLSKMLFFLVLLKYVASRRFWPDRIPSADITLLMGVLGLAAAAVTLFSSEHTAVFAGGELRNGWLRVAVVATNFALTILPLAVLNACRIEMSVSHLLRAFVFSVVVLCVIGWGQYVAFQATGTDYLPIGMFQGDAADLRSGFILSTTGDLDLRPSAFAGEPKDLAMFAATAVLILIPGGRRLLGNLVIRVALIAFLIGTILITRSSSGLLTLPVGLAVLMLMRVQRRPLSSSALFAVYATFAIVMLAVFLQRVNGEAVPVDEVTLGPEPVNTIADLLYQRTLGRISVEDFDWVILKAFLDDPVSIVIGSGFGLGHLSAAPFIPDVWYHYMNEQVVFPKSGVTFALANGGIVWLLLFALFFSRITPTSSRSSPSVLEAQQLVISLFILVLLRISVFEVAVFVASACILTVQQNLVSRRLDELSLPSPKPRHGGRLPTLHR